MPLLLERVLGRPRNSPEATTCASAVAARSAPLAVSRAASSSVVCELRRSASCATEAHTSALGALPWTRSWTCAQPASETTTTMPNR